MNPYGTEGRFIIRYILREFQLWENVHLPFISENHTFLLPGSISLHLRRVFRFSHGQKSCVFFFCFCFCFLRLKCKNNLCCTLIPVVYIEVLDSNHSPTRNPLEGREASLNISESPLLRQVRQKCPLDFTSLLQMCYWDTEFLVTYWRQIAQQYDERRALRLCPIQQFFHLSFPHCCWGCTKAVGTFFLSFFN